MWQALLPRLPFMTRYFPAHAPGFVLTHDRGFVIFVERGWGAFGWYDVLFRHWVYVRDLRSRWSSPSRSAPGRRAASGRGCAATGSRWLALIAMPVAVILGFEAAYYTPAPEGRHRRIRPLRVPRDRARSPCSSSAPCTRSGGGACSPPA